MQKKIISISIYLLFPLFLFAVQGGKPRIGDTAPNIVSVNNNGQTISLSNLRGKLVLIHFWASWCKPCLHESPTLVRTYYKYKDKKYQQANGFTILSVSLDQDQMTWKKTIIQYQLLWKNHACDFQGPSSTFAKQYGIVSIPANFLIDGNGKIIAVNLRGENLAQTLESMLE